MNGHLSLGKQRLPREVTSLHRLTQINRGINEYSGQFEIATNASKFYKVKNAFVASLAVLGISIYIQICTDYSLCLHRYKS